MFWSTIFSSRKEKEDVLKNIIKQLSISQSEKDIYILSLEILDSEDFDVFYKKIVSNYENLPESPQYSIEPLSSKII